MVLKIKAFIYRFSCIFGKRIYLAQKEEDAYFAEAKFADIVLHIISGRDHTNLRMILSVGIWHADNGFTSLYTGDVSRIKALKRNIIHLFKG
jgi:ethanolamine utilization microcompartment shell protein EutL